MQCRRARTVGEWSRIFEQREKEFLLRGASFHIVQMTSEEVDGQMIHTLQLVVMNANCEHGTELILDEGTKKRAEKLFFIMLF